MEDHIREILRALGEDPDREGLRDTPARVSEAYRFLTRGYRMNLEDVLNAAVFEEQVNHMVFVKDIEIYSLCEHHMLPFFGRCHIGYIPKGRVIGVSKLARIAELFARRLQIQERLTSQIADTLMEAIRPEGVGVVVEARHLCMMMRGVEKQNSMMITSAMLGCFQSSLSTRSEFLALLRHDTH